MTDKTTLEAGKCQTCKFYMAITQLEDEWRGGWQQFGTCHHDQVKAGVVIPEYGCGAWEKHPNVELSK